jgi:hypothetical protein
LEVGDFVSTDQFVCRTPGQLPSGYGRENSNNRFHGGAIYNDTASGFIWVKNQVSLGSSETIMGKERFEQWLYDIACVEVKHFHGDNGIFSSEEYRLECFEKKQLQSFSGVGAQHQNSKAELAIQTIMYMACTFLVHSSLHWTDMGADDISLWPLSVKHVFGFTTVFPILSPVLLLWNYSQNRRLTIATSSALMCGAVLNMFLNPSYKWSEASKVESLIQALAVLGVFR